MILLGGDGNEVQEDLLDYMNNDRKEVVILHDEVSALYDEALTFEDDETMYAFLIESVIPKSRELVEKAESISVETEEVRKIHELYLSAINQQDQAFTIMLSALESGDFETIALANEKLDEARASMREHNAALENLAKENDVELID